jgi:hypothetical protein
MRHAARPASFPAVAPHRSQGRRDNAPWPRHTSQLVRPAGSTGGRKAPAALKPQRHAAQEGAAALRLRDAPECARARAADLSVCPCAYGRARECVRARLRREPRAGELPVDSRVVELEQQRIDGLEPRALEAGGLRRRYVWAVRLSAGSRARAQRSACCRVRKNHAAHYQTFGNGCARGAYVRHTACDVSGMGMRSKWD